MNKSIKPEFTPYSSRVFYYLFFNRSPLGDLRVKILYALMTLLLLALFNTSPSVSQITESTATTVKIGLLIPDSNSIAAVQGAELAIREANEKGGLNGRHFQLVARSMEGPWGTGSKEAVNLIFKEKVWALLGSHDGRNAHTVEQAATRSVVVFVSAWTSDPTLSQAFVPWFFNCVPNDNQQASALTEEIYNKKKFKKTVVVSGNDYDSKMATESFLKSVKKSGRPDPVKFNYDKYSLNLDDLSNDIKKADADCAILFCLPKASIKIAGQIRLRNPNLPLFGSLMLLNENVLSPNELQVFDNILSVPSCNWPGQENKTFRQEFQRTFNKNPGMVASYSYDGMNLLIEAIRNAGSSDHELMQKSLEKICHRGVTGLIQFDDKGNRSGSFETIRIKNGVPTGSE